MWLINLSDPYILVTGNITTARDGNESTKVAFKNCALFTKCITHINDEHFDNADNFDIIILCTIWLNISIIIETLQEVYVSLKETNKIWAMETLLMLLLLLLLLSY